jgi:mannose-1-phosphate guanylyltransferase
LPLIPPEDIFIITSRTLLEPMRSALLMLPAQNIVAEPFKRNTAPCLALAAAFIAERYAKDGIGTDEISIAVLTADQSIKPTDKFIATVEAALDYVEKENALATIGIQPIRPETGYGYIETDKAESADSGTVKIMKVIRFREKPDFDTAYKFWKAGNFLWNSGMFFWRLDNFIQSMLENSPDIGLKIEPLRTAYRGRTNVSLPDALERAAPPFEAMPDISIDYALMEKAQNTVVVRALFDWDDVGSWDSLDRFKEKDSDSNIIQGKVITVDSKDSVIINASQNSGILVAGIGMENFVIVVTDDAVLVCPKDKVQDVKKCVDKIKRENWSKWL